MRYNKSIWIPTVGYTSVQNKTAKKLKTTREKYEVEENSRACGTSICEWINREDSKDFQEAKSHCGYKTTHHFEEAPDQTQGQD